MCSECCRRSLEVVTLTVSRATEPCFTLSNGYVLVKCRFHKTCSSKDAFFLFSPLDFMALQSYIKHYRRLIVPEELHLDPDSPIFPASKSGSSNYDKRFYHTYTSNLSNVGNYIENAYRYCELGHDNDEISLSTCRLRHSVVSAYAQVRDPAVMSSLSSIMSHTPGVQYRNYTYGAAGACHEHMMNASQRVLDRNLGDGHEDAQRLAKFCQAGNEGDVQLQRKGKDMDGW